MWSFSVTLIFLTAVSPACGQMRGSFSRLFLSRGAGSGTTGMSSTFMSSSSWTTSGDGQMHQETHKFQRQTIRDFETSKMVQRKQSAVDCKNGDCHKMMHIQAAAPRFHEKMLAHFMPSVWSGKGKPGTHSKSWAFSHPPIMKQPVVVVRVPRSAFLAPRTYAEVAPQADADAHGFMLAGGAGLAAAAGVLAIGALLKCHRTSASKARERPMRELAQPLALEQADQMKCGDAVRTVVPIVAPRGEAIYLARVYEQASELVQLRATRAYLARVYSNAVH